MVDKMLVNAFVDIRTTLTQESGLVIAIKNRFEDLILFMLKEIWIANGSGKYSSWIFGRILNSKFDSNGQRISDALSLLKLYPVLTLLLKT